MKNLSISNQYFLIQNDDKLTTTTTIHDEFWVNNHLRMEPRTSLSQKEREC